MSGDGELMLTILASYAQEESRSASENMRWRIKAEFKEGRATYGRMFGYRWKEGTFLVVPEEARWVKEMFSMYLAGHGLNAIARELNNAGVKTAKGKRWRAFAVAHVLANIDYTGDIVLQKTFRKDHLCKRKSLNRGEHPKYLVEGAFEPIIDKETFKAARREAKRRAEKYRKRSEESARLPYSGKLICGHCGAVYTRRVCKGKHYWICSTYNFDGKAKCGSKQIPEDCLMEYVPSMDGISAISVMDGNLFAIRFQDGRIEERRWKGHSRRDSWTEEMKEKARQRAIAQRRKGNA